MREATENGWIKGLGQKAGRDTEVGHKGKWLGETGNHHTWEREADQITVK